MKQRPDLSPLDLFLLVFLSVRRESSSAYDLRTATGLQWGGMRASLAKLERLGLLGRGDPGRRRRRELTVTEKGGRELRRNWRQSLEASADAESVIRGALLATQFAPATAPAFLDEAAARRRAAARGSRSAPPDVSALYQHMRASLRLAEAGCFERLRDELTAGLRRQMASKEGTK